MKKTIKRLLAIMLCAMAALTLYPAFSAATPAVDNILTTETAAMHSYIKPIIAGTGYPYWSIADHLDSVMATYKATGDRRLLYFLVEAGEGLLYLTSSKLGRKDDYRKKLVDAWISNQYSCGKNYAEMVHAMVMIAPVAEAYTILLSGQQLDAGMRKRISSGATEMEKVFTTFNDLYNSQGFYATSPLETSAACSAFKLQPKSVMPLNMVSAAARAHFHMYYVEASLNQNDKRDFHKTRFTSIAKYVRSQIQTTAWNHKPVLVWKYAATQSWAEDPSHGYLTVQLAQALYQKGWGPFTKTDMTCLANTFDMLYNGFLNSKVRTKLSVNSALSSALNDRLPLTRYVGLCVYEKSIKNDVEKLRLSGARNSLGDSLFAQASISCP